MEGYIADIKSRVLYSKSVQLPYGFSSLQYDLHRQSAVSVLSCETKQ